MTDAGREYAIDKMSKSTTLAQLRTVWEGLGFQYQAHPEVMKSKDEFKAKLTDGRAG